MPVRVLSVSTHPTRDAQGDTSGLAARLQPGPGGFDTLCPPLLRQDAQGAVSQVHLGRSASGSASGDAASRLVYRFSHLVVQAGCNPVAYGRAWFDPRGPDGHRKVAGGQVSAGHRVATHRPSSSGPLT